ncbi:MAG: GlxA family transcriptional regulator [Alphaproteobacteria bacterium]|nr:GlxA family transcriptional regulator [Alphaproteobacteria bacterium]
MFTDPPTSLPQVIGFILVPNFSMIAFSSAVEPLRSANRMSGRDLYEWRIITIDGNPVAASSGLKFIPDYSSDTAGKLDALVVCAGAEVTHVKDDKIFAFLRRQERSGVKVGGICTGAHILARAGLLNDKRCTIHWENLPGFQEEFPELDARSDLFEIDGDRFTCAGGTAALDMMLHLISRQHGAEIGRAVAEQFILDRIRENHDKQRMELRARLGISHPKLIQVIAEMEQSIEEPLSQIELAQASNLSTRQLERLFRKYLGCTPTRYYLMMRLERARQLLAQTSMSILSVALACGFVSASHFSKCYREYFGRTPRAERAQSET